VAGIDVSPSLAAAEAERDKAEAALASVKELADKAEKVAFDSAKAAAEAAVAKLKAEAEAYYNAKVAALAGKAKVPVNAKNDAAQKAALPYMAAALKTQGLVFAYNQKANDVIAGAHSKVALAHRLSAQANQEQAAGDAVMANRHMIQAHGLMVGAQMDEDSAKGIFKLAREFNQVVPMYQAAGRQAAEAALAFTQIGSEVDEVHEAQSAARRQSNLQQFSLAPADAPSVGAGSAELRPSLRR
jgi:hypothetical protein